MTLEDRAIETCDLSVSNLDEADRPVTFTFPQSPFLCLLRELRDMIYKYYVQEDQGLFYDYGSGTMRVANGQKPDTSFAFTCSQVACEMEGVALMANTITFSTAYTEVTARHAEMFHYAMRDFAEEKSEVVNKMALTCLHQRSPKR
jgi:hypothetical protein